MLYLHYLHHTLHYTPLLSAYTDMHFLSLLLITLCSLLPRFVAVPVKARIYSPSCVQRVQCTHALFLSFSLSAFVLFGIKSHEFLALWSDRPLNGHSNPPSHKSPSYLTIVLLYIHILYCIASFERLMAITWCIYTVHFAIRISRLHLRI